MDKRLIIYVASNIRFIDFWKKLRDSGVVISSTWIDHVPERGDKKAISRIWLNCFQEIQQSDMVMVKAEKEDKFKGVLVEVGAALVLGKPVYLVGENNNMGDVYHHPLFYKVSSPEEAITHFAAR
jgi:nucleoside 2-deoxyribosyltransferase